MHVREVGIVLHIRARIIVIIICTMFAYRQNKHTHTHIIYIYKDKYTCDKYLYGIHVHVHIRTLEHCVEGTVLQYVLYILYCLHCLCDFNSRARHCLGAYIIIIIILYRNRTASGRRVFLLENRISSEFNIYTYVCLYIYIIYIIIIICTDLTIAHI